MTIHDLPPYAGICRLTLAVDESRQAGLGTSLATLRGTDPPIRPEGVYSVGVPLTGQVKGSVTGDLGDSMEAEWNEYGDEAERAGKD
jgi:hypothetical protein